MAQETLTEFCFRKLSQHMALERIPGFEDIEKVNLASGESGGGIKLYRADKIDKVSLVDFVFGQRGAPVPHYDNQICTGAELFQIIPDYSYKLPVWGINSVIMKDGAYHFDTDFSFGFDLVTDYDYTMRYLDPFNEIYKKFCAHPDFKRVFLDETTTWVRAYISPVFIIARTTVDKVQTVYELCEELIKLWISMYREAEKVDDAFREKQKQRIFSQYAGMKDTDRMAKVIQGLYSRETFAQFFKAMS